MGQRHEVGYSEDSRTPAEFDVTKYLSPAPNPLAVEVYRLSDGSYLEDQDMFRLSGIFRDVYLWSRPAAHVRDFEMRTDLDARLPDGTLQATVAVRNAGKRRRLPSRAKLELFDAAGKPVVAAVDEEDLGRPAGPTANVAARR